MKTLRRLMELLLGHKYYLCVVNRVGTDIYEVNSTMFRTKDEVEVYKQQLLATRMFQWVETISFRTRTDYVDIY